MWDCVLKFQSEEREKKTFKSLSYCHWIRYILEYVKFYFDAQGTFEHFSSLLCSSKCTLSINSEMRILAQLNAFDFYSLGQPHWSVLCANAKPKKTYLDSFKLMANYSTRFYDITYAVIYFIRIYVCMYFKSGKFCVVQRLFICFQTLLFINDN